MKRPSLHAGTLSVIASTLVFIAFLNSPACIAEDSTKAFQEQTKQFREERARSLQQPDGWLSLAGLEWLAAGANTIGSALDNSVQLPSGAPPHLGTITQRGTGAEATLHLPPPGSGGFRSNFRVDGKPASEGDLSKTAELTFGTFSITPIARGDRVALRIRNTQAESRIHFHGLSWYPAQERYRVQAKWIPYATPHSINIPTIIGTTLHETARGAAEFSVNGKTVRLEPIQEGDKLFFILLDTTSRTTTYGAARFLYADLPTNGLAHPGTLTLDLNRLVNPPCAYTPYATCPLPPPQNKLQVSIEAGEKRYHD